MAGWATNNNHSRSSPSLDVPLAGILRMKSSSGLVLSELSIFQPKVAGVILKFPRNGNVLLINDAKLCVKSLQPNGMTCLVDLYRERESGPWVCQLQIKYIWHWQKLLARSSMREPGENHLCRLLKSLAHGMTVNWELNSPWRRLWRIVAGGCFKITRIRYQGWQF